MSEFNTNYSSLCCPYCDKSISKNKRDNFWVNDLKDEEKDFFQCLLCKNFFKAELIIHKEYMFKINKPTNKEIELYNLIIDEDEEIIKDVPGQMFIWQNLFLNKS